MSNWVTKEVDDRIANMVDAVRRFRYRPQATPRPFVTISREYGCGGFEVAKLLAKQLNEFRIEDPPWAVYDRILVERVSGDSGIADYLIESMTKEHRTAFEEFLRKMVLKLPSRDHIFRRIARLIKSLAWHGHAVIVGRGGVFLCKDMPRGFHLQIVAPAAWRLKRLAGKAGSEDPARVRRRMDAYDKDRLLFFEKHFNKDVRAAHEFDLIVNNSTCGSEQIVNLVLRAMELRGMLLC